MKYKGREEVVSPQDWMRSAVVEAVVLGIGAGEKSGRRNGKIVLIDGGQDGRRKRRERVLRWRRE